MLDRSTFFACLAAEFGLDPTELTPERRLLEDLGFDSISTIELCIWIEDLAPGDRFVKDDELPETLADTYDTYLSLVSTADD